MMGDDWVYFDNEFILRQYTGLKDKNGVEIYEGDIIKTTLPSHIGSDEYEIDISQVEFFEGGFVIDEILPLGAFADVSEVIGNIYEHPELLTKEKENAL